MKSLISYGTVYGSSRSYAEELSRKLDIQCFPARKLPDLADIDTMIHIGGLYAGGIKDLKEVLNKLDVNRIRYLIIITVGLSDPAEEKNTETIRNQALQGLSEELLPKVTFFHLRGAIDYTKLGFLHKAMMRLVYTKAKKDYKKNPSKETKGFLDSYGTTMNFVDYKTLEPIMEEIKNREQL